LAPAARDAPLSAGFDACIAGEAGEGDLSGAGARSPIIEAVRKANGKDAKSPLSFSNEW
jgi:hypothetical protein